MIGLAHSLSQLTDGDKEYLFCVWTDSQDWLRPYVSGNARILELGPRPVRRRKLSPRDALKRIPGARTARDEFAYPLGKRSVQLQRGDPGVEKAGADLVHFPLQAAFLTELPSIYHPHDLQHLHLPRNFTRRERVERAVRSRAFCEQASLVAVASTWTKNDILEQFRLPAEKIAVVPLAPILGAYDEPEPEYCDRLRATYGLPTETHAGARTDLAPQEPPEPPRCALSSAHQTRCRRPARVHRRYDRLSSRRSNGTSGD